MPSFACLKQFWVFTILHCLGLDQKEKWLARGEASYGKPVLHTCILRALSFCQNWPARPVSLQRKCNDLKEHLHDNPSHCSGGVYIILEVCYSEGVVELFLPNGRSGQSLLSNGKRPKARFKRRTLHVPNLMQMRKIYCFLSFALDSAHVKFDV